MKEGRRAQRRARRRRADKKQARATAQTQAQVQAQAQTSISMRPCRVRSARHSPRSQSLSRARARRARFRSERARTCRNMSAASSWFAVRSTRATKECAEIMPRIASRNSPKRARACSHLRIRRAVYQAHRLASDRFDALQYANSRPFPRLPAYLAPPPRPARSSAPSRSIHAGRKVAPRARAALTSADAASSAPPPAPASAPA
jgi:hypothetical protein